MGRDGEGLIFVVRDAFQLHVAPALGDERKAGGQKGDILNFRKARGGRVMDQMRASGGRRARMAATTRSARGERILSFRERRDGGVSWIAELSQANTVRALAGVSRELKVGSSVSQARPSSSRSCVLRNTASCAVRKALSAFSTAC